MSIRINLLPEARLASIKNKQTRRLVTIVAVTVCSSIGIIVVVLLLLYAARNVQYAANTSKITTLKKQVADKSGEEQDIAWFNAALTEGGKENENRILISQLFDYLAKAVPEGVTLADISVDKEYKVKASVKARDYNNVALFLKALSTYNVDYGRIAGFEAKQVFTDVDVNAVSKGKQSGGADFEITFKVDQDLVKKFRVDNAKGDSTSALPGGSNTSGGGQ